jgi:hypothetical protein
MKFTWAGVGVFLLNLAILAPIASAAEFRGYWISGRAGQHEPRFGSVAGRLDGRRQQ